MQFFQDMLQFWKDTWTQSRILFLAEMSGTFCALFSAFLLGFSSGEYLALIFMIYNLSNVLLIYTSYVRGNAWMIFMMSSFFILNIYGLINLYLH